jgi:hypothetical protein
MRYAFYLVLASCMISGCGSPEVENVPPSVVQKVSVIDADGQRETIAISELFDDQTGEPLFAKVYCVDRRSGKKVWIDPNALKQRSQSSSHLVPISE